MTFGRLRLFARTQRRRLALLAFVVCLAAMVVVAHGAPGEHHMGDGTAMCVAIVAAGGTALLALTRAGAAVIRAPLGVLGVLAMIPALLPSAKTVRARAGPSVLQVFLR